MTCEELQDDYELYSLGLLEGVEKEEIEAHLARGCEACQKRLKDALAVNSLLLSHAPEVVPPSRLKRRVLAGVGIQPTGWTWLAAIAAASMLVVALWLRFEQHSTQTELASTERSLRQTAAERDRLAQVLTFLDQPETRQVNFGAGEPKPKGNVFVHSRLGVLLIASNLPPLKPGRIYEMWVIPKGGAPVPAGLFQSDGKGGGVNILPGAIDIGTVGAIAVTDEPESGSPGPTTTPIIAAPIAG